MGKGMYINVIITLRTTKLIINCGIDGRGPQHQSIERAPKCQIEATTRVMVKEGSRGRIIHVINSSVE